VAPEPVTRASGRARVLPTLARRQVPLADTRVQHSIMVTNTSTVARSYGVRNLWDWDLGGVDALWFRPLVAAAAYTQTFFAQTTPVFHAFEHVDDPAMPTFHAYGTVRDGLLNATPPDRFGYVAWLDLFEAPWDTPVINDALDSATVHYWGFVAPLVLTPGASATFRQYASTSATAIGTASDAVAEVTTLSYAALSMLAILLLTAASVTKSCRSITAA